MSIAIAVATIDGIALVSDSKIDSPIAGFEPKKILGVILDGKKYAFCITGHIRVNKVVYSIFESLEKSFQIRNPSFEQVVNHFVVGIKKEFKEKFQDYKGENQERQIEFIICGYEENNVLCPVIQRHNIYTNKQIIETTEDKCIHEQKNTNKENGNKYTPIAIGKKQQFRDILNKRNDEFSHIPKEYSNLSAVEALQYLKIIIADTCDKQPEVCGPPIKAAILSPSIFLKGTL